MARGSARRSVWRCGTAVFLAAVSWRCAHWIAIPPQDLPSDLLDLPIVELALPAKIDRLDWVPRNLKNLDVSHTAVTDLSYLPAGLEELNASFTMVRHLSALPRRLRALDISSTYVHRIAYLPRRLVRLSLGSTRLTTVDALPPQLEELDVEGATLQDLPVLPATLRVLRLGGQSIESLEGLPGSLRSLTLSGTGVTSLKGLPRALELLELDHNKPLEKLGIDFLPSYLQALITDQATIPAELRRLHFLKVLDARYAIPDAHLPPSLTTLRVRDLPPGKYEFPPDLRLLGLIGFSVRDLAALRLPLTLQALELDYCLNDRLNLHDYPQLRQLSLSFSRVTHLENLPTDLLSLDLNGTSLDELPALPRKLRILRLHSARLTHLPAILPEELRILDIGDAEGITALPSRLPEKLQTLLVGGTKITALPGLPPNLRELDIAGTPIHQLATIPGGLPASLEKLRIAPGQLCRIGPPPRHLSSLRFAREEP